ncbi:methylase/methyltransferase [Leptospira ryugenii]|uniref:Methylase/methyltransferase n=1 Tax=Leptospira ryugenii TaxID=1917863 RepID=A0A2P2E537_9LEPT|nr:metalloregulator ArsR/SmtB family transcription factor [Leptospira ryugenii]GBF51990.1 methylase/methyltransferase [Leptospira ryugenii]
MNPVVGSEISVSPRSKGILDALKAVSDETRLRILHILSLGAFSVNEVVEILGMGQSRVSRHLKILTEAKVIRSRREGSLVYSYLPDVSLLEQESFRYYQELSSLLLSYREDLPFWQRDLRMVHQILEQRERKSKGFFDRIAKDWESLQGEVLHPKLYRSWILEQLPNQLSTIVDLGCGPGGLIPYLLPKAKQLLGVDSSANMIEEAQSLIGNNQNVQFVQAQLESIPMPDASVDAVVSSMVLHHISHPPAVLDEVHRILKPDGILCIVDLEKHNQEMMRDNFADLWLGFEPELLESWLTNSGFSVEFTESIKTESIFKILTIKAKKRGGQNVPSN